MVVVRDDVRKLPSDQNKYITPSRDTSNKPLDHNVVTNLEKHYGDMAKRLVEMEFKMEDIRNKIKQLQAKKQERTTKKVKGSKLVIRELGTEESTESYVKECFQQQPNAPMDSVRKIAAMEDEKSVCNIKNKQEDNREKLRQLFDVYLKQALEKKQKEGEEGNNIKVCPRPQRYKGGINSTLIGNSRASVYSDPNSREISPECYIMTNSWTNNHERIPSQVNLLNIGEAFVSPKVKKESKDNWKSRMIVPNQMDTSTISSQRPRKSRYQTEYNQTIGATALLVEQEARVSRPIVDASRHLRHSKLFPDTTDEESLSDIIQEEKKPTRRNLLSGSRVESMSLRSSDVMRPAPKANFTK